MTNKHQLTVSTPLLSDEDDVINKKEDEQPPLHVSTNNENDNVGASDTVGMMIGNNNKEKNNYDKNNNRKRRKRRKQRQSTMIDAANASWRNMLAFFICGLLNNYGYVLIGSAAENLLPNFAGVILLCEIIPSLIVKLTAPLYFHLIPYNLRVIVFVLMQSASFLIIAFVRNKYLMLSGIVLGAISCGGGEVTFLQMSSYYHKDTVSTWSSGTGGAGIFGAFTYLALHAWMGLSPNHIMLLSTILPLFTLISVFVLMTKHHAPNGFFSTGSGKQFESPTSVETKKKNDSDGREVISVVSNGDVGATDGEAMVATVGDDEEQLNEMANEVVDLEQSSNQITVKERLQLLFPLTFWYMLPLAIVYFMEYLINFSIAQNLNFKTGLITSNNWIYYSTIYQIGVFISRSSVKLFPIRRLWFPAFFQTLNVLILLLDAYFRVIPAIWFIFVIILWEGLLGGSIYVNVYYRMSIEIEPKYREYSFSVVSNADSFGISLAGLCATFLQGWLKEHQSHRYI